ncbi:IS200/IS605 family transposase [Mucilaginibacter mali]|uniref:IS200/IS605 family transposase n=1 Tax=Mucilaginibacter mali TaxID=2740462 RepID=A0A7D4TXY3_9SPHI|nr:IS200/IS605 family transposase [Mucilaginibacter mali]QKJ32695.1 IS200/IS605 family transposase [Mucilaginibacter mali]
MPQSYSALWVHLIWSTKNRQPILTPDLRKELFNVTNSISKEYEIYLDCINGIEDHVHLLVRLRTDQTVADVVKTIKGNTWEHFKEIPDQYITWQDGFAAFSVSPANLKAVRNYIYRQQIHHKNKSFTDELKEIKAGIRLQDKS